MLFVIMYSRKKHNDLNKYSDCKLSVYIFVFSQKPEYVCIRIENRSAPGNLHLLLAHNHQQGAKCEGDEKTRKKEQRGSITASPFKDSHSS